MHLSAAEKKDKFLQIEQFFFFAFIHNGIFFSIIWEEPAQTTCIQKNERIKIIFKSFMYSLIVAVLEWMKQLFLFTNDSH